MTGQFPEMATHCIPSQCIVVITADLVRNETIDIIEAPVDIITEADVAKLKLDALGTEHYKNISLTENLKLTDLNVWIGPNGSGKSNFIAILKFLKDCTVSTTDESRVSSQFEDAISALGGVKILDKSVKSPGKVKFSFQFAPTEELEKGLRLRLELHVNKKTSVVTISHDSLSDGHSDTREPFYYYKFHDRRPGEGVVSVYNDTTERSSHFENVNNVPINSLGLVKVHDLLEESENPPQRTPIYKVRRIFLDCIRRWHFYNSNYMNLDIIRTTEPKIGSSDIFLTPAGSNLAIVIENLIQQDIDFEDSLNRAMKAILPQTRRLRPIRTGLMNVNLEWHVNGVTDPFYLSEMSDGTIRMLCWATILLSPNPPCLLVIDEPEVGIHAAWLPVLAEWIKQASRKTQVIVTTHSPDLLDNFTDSINNVYTFSFGNDRNHFHISSLSSEALQNQLEEGWKLGDLYRVGDPMVGGWPW